MWREIKISLELAAPWLIVCGALLLSYLIVGMILGDG